jgi:8-oxo-dGTP diphosphatase
VRSWTVAGALIPCADGLVLVANRRRDGSVEWTPPGGVVDPGETVLGALAREVAEETGLRVTSFGERAYTVRVDAPGLGWRMRVEAWHVTAVEGEVAIADPDGIVEHVRFADRTAVDELLISSPLWVSVPVLDWLGGGGAASFGFALHGTSRAAMQVERVH